MFIPFYFILYQRFSTANIYLIENTEYDFNDDYFSDIVGVTKHLESEPQKIRLWVSQSLYPYVHTKPLHDTQKLKRFDANGYEIE